MAPAWAADVISSNVVGYNKITLHPGMNMIGGLFQGVGTGEALSLNGQFSNDATVSTSGYGADDADSILLFNDDTQEYGKRYYFYYDAEDEDAYNNKWYDTADISGEPTTDSLAGGVAGWYRYRGNSSVQICMAGEVPTNAVYQVTLHPGMNFVANPYPARIALNGNSFTVTGITSGYGADDADSILLFNAGTQEYGKRYYFYYDAEDEEAYNNKWYDTGDVTGEPTTDTLEPGVGFWYRHRGTSTATLNFTKPY